MDKKYLVIDFDGTIFTDSFPEVGTLIPHADTVINQLKANGNVIVINTCRSGKFEGMAQDALESHGVNYDWINCNPPELIEMYKQDCRKLSAHNGVYIDNKNFMGLPTNEKGVVDWLKIKDLLWVIHGIK